jgi:hypothetical protein
LDSVQQHEQGAAGMPILLLTSSSIAAPPQHLDLL